MNIDEVTDKIKAEIESGDFKLQAVFDRNIQEIENLKNEGYTYNAMFERLDGKIEHPHFRDLVYRAKKKKIKSPSSSVRETREPKARDKASDQSQNEHSTKEEGKPETKYTKKDWHKVGVRRETVITQLEENGITPEQVSDWQCPNETRIAKRLAEYLMKQK